MELSEALVEPLKDMVLNYGIVLIISLFLVFVVSKIASFVRVPKALIKIILPFGFLFIFYQLWTKIIL